MVYIHSGMGGEAMKYDYDIITIGLGPAGMAVSIMGAEMGLKVCAIEKNKVGGECMNVGCIPSKALLRMAKMRQSFEKLAKMELDELSKPAVRNPFSRIQESLNFISEKKTMSMFDKVHMVYQEGPASFIDPHTVEVSGKRYSAKRIFICVGTSPAVPPFPGIEEVEYLTNENIFHLESIPESLMVVGGGAIACEMAQAFCRLGSKVKMVIRGPRLMWRENEEASQLLEETLEKEGIEIFRKRKPISFENNSGHVVITTDTGEQIEAEKVLCAAGRSYRFDSLKLDNAKVARDKNGAIHVNHHLQTSQRHIFACGDCNGFAQLSHSAMHQGMIAIMNSMMPWPFKRNFTKFVVPWTIFSEPQVSHVGPRESELIEKGVKYESIKVSYADYGAAIAEHVDTGFVNALVSPMGKIYAATIVGEGSGEMINEWALAIQKKIRIHDIMMLQHSFPTMGFLSKRVAETWMMNKMKSKTLQKLCQLMFRW